jgi:prepilin-type processing-associated H-X9-DG protein
VLSYAANAGWIQDDPPTGDVSENPANGVFTDQSRVPVAGSSGQLPQDMRDTPAGDADPLIGMTSAYIGSKGDGLTNTVMLSENLKAYLWTYMANEHHGTGAVPDKKYHFGVCWEDPTAVAVAPVDPAEGYKTETGYRKINGQRVDNAILFTTFEDDEDSGMLPNYGFPSSNHSGGVNMAFCGGAVKFVSEEISPTVYAQLMTTNRKGSDLKDVDGKLERKLKQPSDDEF